MKYDVAPSPKTTSIFRKFEGGEKNPHFFFVCVSLFVEKSIWGKKRSRRGGCTRRDIITGVDLPLKIAPSLLGGKAELGGGKYCLRRLALGGMKLRTIYEEIGKRNFPRVFSPPFSRHRYIFYLRNLQVIELRELLLLLWVSSLSQNRPPVSY